MKETIEHNNRFYGEELKTESEQLKEWLIVANKEIERLTKQNKALNEMYELTKKEYIRLNNIINELEKYLIAEIEDYDKSINSKFITDISKEQYEGEKVCFEDMLGRLQELKGSDKE